MCILGWIIALWCYLAGGTFMFEFLDSNKPFITKRHEKALNVTFIVFWPLIMLAGLAVLLNTKARTSK